MQIGLFAETGAPVIAPDGIDVRCCDVREMLSTVAGAQFVQADPCWIYRNTGAADGFNGAAKGHYEGLPCDQIANTLNAAYDSAADDAYLVVWVTFPLLEEWIHATSTGPWRWRNVGGGTWQKTRMDGLGSAFGIGFHSRGDSELWLTYVKGHPKPRRRDFSNAQRTPRTEHSEKPVETIREMVRTYSDPGGLVLSAFSGLAPEARACWHEGRRMVGAEIDPERHAEALRRLAEYRRLNSRF